MPPRIVIDTNILVGAMLNATDGANREVLRHCLLRKAHPLLGAALFHEYEDLMARNEILEKSPLPPLEREALFASLLSVCEWVRVFYLWRPNLQDEGDNHLVELAVAGGAQAIVTNNVRDLRSGELRFPSLRILTPTQFLESL